MSKKTSIFELARDERGTVLPLFALMSTVAIAAVGGAVDYGRAYQLKAKMQNALDASIVSGLRVYQEKVNNGATSDEAWTAAQAEAQTLFTSQFPGAVMQNANGNAVAGLDQPILAYTFAPAGSQLTGSASMTANTPFWKFVTSENLSTVVSSIADLSGAQMNGTTGKMLEVAMMVDLTGSMGESRNGQTKIAGLKAAGLDMLDILLPDSGANNNSVRIGLAPFADYVNAGPYASAVTGLAPTGGAYSNITNLSWTKQGPWTGSYSGGTAGTAGSQSGATPPASGASYGGSGSTTSNGATYNNAYCSSPTQSVTTQVPVTMTTQSFGTADVGTPVNYGAAGSVNSAYYYQNSHGTWYYISFAGYYGSRPVGYLYYQRNNGSWAFADYGLYYNAHIPNQTSQTTTSTVTGCESTASAPATSKLISCVTERTDQTNRYSAAAPGGSAGYIGSYNHGVTSKYNYSSDGKCYVAGRELPAVTPLTSDKATLKSFFNTATIGGGTPGHLGTAWASYLLSPDWSNIWPVASTPVAYSNAGTIKVAILLSDGEYNMQYSGPDSIAQAKQTCDEMKAKGIQIYSIGFGFSANSQASDGSYDGNAKATLKYCASSDAHYFFPYDGAALRTAFQSIGNALTTQMTSTTTQRGARVTH